MVAELCAPGQQGQEDEGWANASPGQAERGFAGRSEAAFFFLLFPKQCEGSHQVGANCTGLEALGKPARGCKETETGELENKAEKTA